MSRPMQGAFVFLTIVGLAWSIPNVDDEAMSHTAIGPTVPNRLLRREQKSKRHKHPRHKGHHQRHKAAVALGIDRPLVRPLQDHHWKKKSKHLLKEAQAAKPPPRNENIPLISGLGTVHDAVSFPKVPLTAIDGKPGSLAYVTMCILLDVSEPDNCKKQRHCAADQVKSCMKSVCSLHVSTRDSRDKTVMMVNKGAVELMREPLAEYGVKMVVLPELKWGEDQSRYTEPMRSYSFYKLHIWRLTQYDRVFWFDQDVFFLRDASVIPKKYPKAQFAAAKFPLNGGYCSNHVYINSGVMLVTPTMPIFSKLIDMWVIGNYTPAPKERGGHGEQDILCSAYPDVLGEFTEIDACYNFRGYWFQNSCDKKKLILLHGHHDQSQCSNITQAQDLKFLLEDMSRLRPDVDETLYLQTGGDSFADNSSMAGDRSMADDSPMANYSGDFFRRQQLLAVADSSNPSWLSDWNQKESILVSSN